MITPYETGEGGHPQPRRATSAISFAAAALLALISAVASATAAAGDLDRVVLFDIKAMTLDEALLQFGRQADVRISFAGDLSKARPGTAEIKGRYTAKKVLATLLKGTRLRYVEKERTVEILALRQPDPASPAHAGKSLDRGVHPDPVSASAQTLQADDPPATQNPSEDATTDHELSEIIVTAQKYRQSAFDVPISLDVITAQELQRLDITSLNDLQYDVSGLYVNGGNVNHYIVLRGVSNQSGNGALVGQYIDDADISAEGYTGQSGYGVGDLQFYDIDRVEVLKGPQGTLYGDGALGGVIRYITNKPDLDRSELSAEVSTLFTQYGAPSQRVEAMVNAPLDAGTLALRVAGQFQHEGGWVDEPVANLKNINDVNLSDVRIEALWRPSTAVKLLATQIIHREDYGIGSGEDAEGDITPVYGVTLVPTGNQSFTLSNATLTADFAGTQLLNSATYSSHSERDYNQTYAIGEVLGEPPTWELENYLPLASHTFSDELRFHSMSHGVWQWMLGGFYKHELDDVEFGGSQYYGPPGQTLSAATHLYYGGGPQLTASEAAFADTSFNIARFTAGAGVRYFEDRLNFANLGDYLDGVQVYPYLSARGHYTSIDPRFYLQYHQSSVVDVYASAAKGFRSGEPNLGLFEGFNPESLWSYDLGTKLRFLHGRVQSDEDIFYERYSNYVSEGLIDVYGIPTFGTFNIGAAGIKGLDADIAWRISPLWRVAAKGEVVSSKFISITAADTGFVPGENVPMVPSYTFMGSAERDFQWDGRPGFMQVNYSQTARVSGLSPVVDSDVIRFLSFRTGVQWNRNLKLALFVENLLNDRGYLDPFWDEGAAYRPRPRTFGMDFSVNFD